MIPPRSAVTRVPVIEVVGGNPFLARLAAEDLVNPQLALGLRHEQRVSGSAVFAALEIEPPRTSEIGLLRRAAARIVVKAASRTSGFTQ